MIGRQRTDTDRRLVRTHITPKGLAVLAELDAPVRAFHRSRLEDMSRQKLHQLVDMLSDVRSAGLTGAGATEPAPETFGIVI